MQKEEPLSGYQKFVIFILAITQFTVILDFMVMSPLGAILMKSLSLQPSAFGNAVSAYAFAAGISGLLTAGFADKFDRKKLLLFFYTGFICGTIFCGLSQSYAALVSARIITGLFGGVIGSISLAIVTDIFTLQQRGRVMGFIQMGFGGSQVLGVPVGLYLANAWGWESPFWMVAALSILIAVLIATKLQPVVVNLAGRQSGSAFSHLWHTISTPNYRTGFAATALLSIGGFMMMPFGSAFAINNLGLTNHQLPMLFMVSGVSSLILMPIIGNLSDKYDKFTIFVIASVWMMVVSVVYTNLSVTPLLIVMALNVLMMIGIMSRMVPSSALTSAIPAPADRGAFMSINSSLQQFAGGIAAMVAGIIVTEKAKGTPLEHYNIIGYLVVVISILGIFMMMRVNNLTKKKFVNTEEAVDESEILSEGF